MKKLTIARKLLLVNVLVSLILAFAMIQGVWLARTLIYDAEHRLLKTQVDSSLAILNDFADRVDSGQLDLAEAQEQAKAVLGAIRFKGADYMFALDTDGILLIHPNESLVETNVLGIKDPNGVELFVDLLDAAAAGGDFVAYDWPRADADAPLPKMSYAEAFEPWGWVVATGVYIDDLNADFQAVYMTSILEFLLIMLTVSVAIALIARSIKTPVAELIRTVEQIRCGDIDNAVSLAGRPDEVGKIATEVEALRNTLIEKRKGDEEQDRMRQQVEEARLAQENEKRRLEAVEKERKAEELKRAEETAAQEAETRKRNDEETARREREQALIVDSLAEALKSMSKGELDVSIEKRFPEGYDQLRLDFNETVRTLSDLIGNIAASSTRIRSSTAEIAKSAGSLSKRTENSASTLESTAASLNELAESVSSAAEATSRANALSKTSNEKAQKSLEIAEETATAMQRIKESSDEIMTIVDLINGIAFQTNLLALNAGVEAARAGESGRGFAVVASEVRALAQRSSEASDRINELVSTSTQQVDYGSDLVRKSGDELREIVRSMEQISSLVDGIATSSQEQARGIGDVNDAISNLESDTQRNAAISEEASAASTDLDGQAESLNGLVEVFAISSSAYERGVA